MAPDPIDWATARKVARIVAGRDALADSYLGASLHDDFAELTVVAEALVADFTGLQPPGPVTVEVLDRRDWVDSNLASMRRLLEPLMARFGARLAQQPVRAGRPARRGDRDRRAARLPLAAGARPVRPARPRRSAAATRSTTSARTSSRWRSGSRSGPRDFRLWIAIHEVTHRAQFTGVPWMRDALPRRSCSRRSRSSTPIRASCSRAITRALEDVRQGRNPLDDGGLVGLVRFTGAARRARPGAGADVAARRSRQRRDDRARAAARRRRGTHGARPAPAARNQAASPRRCTSCSASSRRCGSTRSARSSSRTSSTIGGFPTFDVVWRSPENLPTLAELDDAPAWLDRVARTRVA